MAEELSAENRLNFIDIVRTARRYYQQLHEAAAQAALVNPRRSRPATPTRSRQASPNPSLPPQPPQAGPPSPAIPTTQKAEEYRNINKRPNLHVGIHYPAVIAEYGLPSHCNVLIGEDKHREYKMQIYNTNYRDVERALLGSENLKQTIRLILQDAFAISEPVLTQLFKDLQAECPVLVNKLLPQSEKTHDILDDDSYLFLKSDANHSQPAALGRLQAKLVRNELSLPIRSSAMDQAFQKMLRTSYEIDYGMSNVMHFGVASIPWSKKVNFNDP
ncbi:MAG: hypothetical protein Q9200_007697 [Gallowayella weberi]